jgi:hypothetical protein
MVGSEAHASLLAWTRIHVNLQQGLELARLADLPSDVIAEGSRIAVKLTELEGQYQRESKSNKITERRKAFLRVLAYWHLFLVGRVFCSRSWLE